MLLISHLSAGDTFESSYRFEQSQTNSEFEIPNLCTALGHNIMPECRQIDNLIARNNELLKLNSNLQFQLKKEAESTTTLQKENPNLKK